MEEMLKYAQHEKQKNELQEEKLNLKPNQVVNEKKENKRPLKYLDIESHQERVIVKPSKDE